MNEWDYFLSGLMRALSWKDGQDNALIGGEPSWTYFIGLLVHFQIFLSLYALLFWGYHKDIKEAGSVKKAMRNKWNTIRQSQKSTGRAIFVTIIGVLLMLFIFPAYEGYRMTNGIWRYHYFTNQETVTKMAVLSEIDTYVGTRKSGYSSVTLTINTGTGKRTVNIANSSQSLARNLKSKLKTPTIVDVEINNKGQIIFIH